MPREEFITTEHGPGDEYTEDSLVFSNRSLLTDYLGTSDCSIVLSHIEDAILNQDGLNTNTRRELTAEISDVSPLHKLVNDYDTEYSFTLAINNYTYKIYMNDTPDDNTEEYYVTTLIIGKNNDYIYTTKKDTAAELEWGKQFSKKITSIKSLNIFTDSKDTTD